MQVQSWSEPQRVVRSAWHRTVQAAGLAAVPARAPRAALPVRDAVPARDVAPARAAVIPVDSVAELQALPAPQSVPEWGPQPGFLPPIAGGEEWLPEARPTGAIERLLSRMVRREVTVLAAGQRVSGKLLETDPVTLTQADGRVVVVELPTVQGVFY